MSTPAQWMSAAGPAPPSPGGSNAALIRQLRVTLGRMELAVGALDEAMVWTDMAGLVQWANPAFARMVGFKRFRILGKSIVDLLPLYQDGKLLPADRHPAVRITAAQGARTPSRGRFEMVRGESRRIVEIHCAIQGCGGDVPGGAVRSGSGGDGQHSSAAGESALGGANESTDAIVLVVRDVTERILAEQWLEQETDKTELLRSVAAAANEAETPAEALQRSLELLCRHLGWPVGQVFPLEGGDPPRILPPDCVYFSETSRFGLFRLETQRLTFAPGEGVPGAIYEAGSPVWCQGDCSDPRFRPDGAGAACGIRTVFGFPVLDGREVAAVVELCTDRIVVPDPDLAELAREIGTQLGRTFERRRAATALMQAKEDLERRVEERTADLSTLNASLINEVSERQQIEGALRETLTRHRDLVHSVRDAMFSVSRQGRAESLNPAFEAITGLSAREWIGRRLLALVHAGDRRQLHARFREAASGGPAASVEVRVGSRCRGWKIVECSLAPRRAGGRITGVLGIARDVTERHLAEQQLRLHQRAIESSSEGIFLIDALSPDRTVIYANSGLEHITGCSSSGAIGRAWPALFEDAAGKGHSLDPSARESLEEALRTGEAVTREIEAARPGGASYWCRVALTPVLDAAGQLTHFVGIVSDVSRQKETERLKNELVATVSHELRTPLTSLRGFAELMLERDYPPEKQKKFLGIINKEATRLTNLINDFLDIQRIESGRQVYTFDRLPLLPILQETVALFRGASASHEFVVDSSGNPVAWADAERLRQVFANLVSNAVKFSPRGGQVVLRLREQAGFACCSVSDQGIGISPEGISKLFQKFSRIDNTETRKIGGTGLGLALVKQIIEAHKGQVAVESARGEGSTFSFTLPLA
ncbi:MAG: PAS domain S-box protein [Bryobacteraceae bacterium]